jgi:hypothetical protein
MGKRIPRVVKVTCLLSFLLCCGCPVCVVLFDYVLFYTDTDRNSLSVLKDPASVTAFLEDHLAVGQSSPEDVLSFLTQENVKDCTTYGDSIVCWILVQRLFFDPKDPSDLWERYRRRGVFTETDYRIIFTFENDKLVRIEVEEHHTAL